MHLHESQHPMFRLLPADRDRWWSLLEDIRYDSSEIGENDS